MTQLLTILLCTCACIGLHAQADIITTIVGQDTAGFCGDGGPASDACLSVLEFLRLDKFGNIFIGDCLNQRVRKIDGATGIITTVAGNGAPGYDGDNALATAAEIDIPEGVCVDAMENIYIADGGNNRIRKVSTSTGIITTVAGSGPTGYLLGGSSGDGGPATDAELNGPGGVSVDRHGNIYIGDYTNNKVRRVDATTGIITTFAGQQGPPMFTGWVVGYSGDGGPATNAVFSAPIQVFCDSVDNVFICDQWNHALRKVDITTGIITTIAGNGNPGHTGDGGPASAATLNQPVGMFIDKQGNIFIAEGAGTIIRKIDGKTNIISTVAGNDTLGFSGDGGPATNAKLNCSDVCVDDYGSLYIADEYNHRVRKVYNPKLVAPAVTENIAVEVFPNPTQSSVTVSYNFTTDGTIQLMDIAGHLVAFNNLSASKQGDVIDVSHLSPGMYLYRVLQNDVLVSSGRIIKQ